MAVNETEIKQAFKDAFPGFTFKDDGAGKSIAVFLDSSCQIYYYLKPENECWRLEFWVNTYARDRYNKQKAIQEIWNGNKRDFEFLGYYSVNGIRKCQRIVSVDDLRKDLEELRLLLQRVETGSSDSHPPTDSSGIGITAMTIGEVLKLPLKVPDYQRGYCWEDANIRGLLDDTNAWQMKHKQGERYRIGTLVLKKQKESGDYDIIDGQQRLVTLCLYAVSKNDGNGNLRLGQNNKKISALNRLLEARECIRNWCAGKDNSGIHAPERKIDLDRVEVSVIVIGENESDDLVFNFFNHLNSSGKPLSDYDLLKSHHLRYIEGDELQRAMAQRWRTLERAGVGNKLGKSDLLHLTLYRLRMWLRGKKDFRCQADNPEFHDLFHEFTMDYEPIEGLCTLRKPVEVDSLLSGGIEFFDYVEKYRRAYDLFIQTEPIIELEKWLNWHSYGTLCQGSKALAFLFFCRFGDIYLKEAVYAIAYRVSKIRNETQVRRNYISSRSEFAEIAQIINRATQDGEVLGKLLDPRTAYTITNRGETAKRYWNALGGLGEKLQGDTLNGRRLISELK